MRKRFVLFVLIPIAIFLVVVWLFLDRWVESGLEYAGEEAVGARVEIDNLHVSLSPIAIEFARLQVANAGDPWKNLFETGHVRFALNFGQLLRSKYIIETMEINDLILGTKRTTDGSLPAARRAKAAEASGGTSFGTMAEDLLAKSFTRTPLYDIAQIRKGINVDSLIRSQNFRSVAHIDTLKRHVTTATRQWEDIKAEVGRSEAKLKEIEKSLRAINPGQIKTPDQIVSAISTVDNASKGITEITRTISNRQASLKSDVSGFAAAVDSIDDFVKRDVQQVLGMARLPDLNTAGIAEALLGRNVMEDIRQYMTYIDLARTHIKNYAPEPQIETPPRRKGQDIHFPVEHAYPKFWIQKAVISGGTDRNQDPNYFYARGEVKNIASDQRITGQPLTIALEGRKADVADFSLGAVFDRRKDTPYDQYTARVAGIRLAEVRLGSSDFLPSTITHALLTTGVRVSIPGSRFDGNVTMAFRNLVLTYQGEPRNIGERIARNILSQIKEFDAALRLWNVDRAFDVAFTTNLDDQFAGGLKSALGAELAKVRADIQARVDQTIAQKRQQFEAFYAEKRKEAEKILGDYQGLVDRNLSLVESKKKELNAQLEKVQKGALDGLMNKILKK